MKKNTRRSFIINSIMAGVGATGFLSTLPIKDAVSEDHNSSHKYTKKGKTDDYAWIRMECEKVVQTCKIKAIDGSILFTPDGVGHYGAMWTRDFAYLVEHGCEFLDQKQVKFAIEILLYGQRKDGAIPDRVNERLVPIYYPGAVKGSIITREKLQMFQEKNLLGALRGPMGEVPALDNPMFMVSLIYHYHQHFKDKKFVASTLSALHQALDFVPMNRGLVYNDPQRPSCTYGFQDNVAKGGHDLFASLLYIIACHQMKELDPTNDEYWHKRATVAENNLWLLFDEKRGIYLAANEICRQVDIWGNAFLVAYNIGDSYLQKKVAQYLAKNYKSYMYAGQVRHLPTPEYWERMFKPLSKDTYQNGGYWGTASGWVIKALQTVDPKLADSTFNELINNYHRGIFEWISPSGSKGPDLYVATILNVWSLVKDKHNNFR